MANEHRRFPRYILPQISALIDGERIELMDISSHGLLIAADSRDMALDDVCQIVLSVPILDKIAHHQIKGKVVRKDSRGIAIDYDTPVRTWPKLLDLLDRKLHAERLTA